MICMYLNMNIKEKETTNVHTGDKYTVTQYFPQECKGSVCPFYSDGTGTYMEGICIRAELEKRE